MRTISRAQLASRLRVSVARLARRLRQEGSPKDTTPSQFTAMSTLDRLGPLTLGELAAVERVKPPTMTRIVSALEERGLVSKDADPVDGRLVRVGLTAAGRKAYDESRRRRDEWLHKRLATLNPDDLETIARAAAIFDRLAEDER
jgi:DNA-binding MarR family transcriptional regulator